ncbi:MAG TPA: MEDS domain-containing protein [Opitutaceae bacterium]|jgi:hypothetical protein|nr:MEDS domain-containing protein [Opitutaceae bacterium]
MPDAPRHQCLIYDGAPSPHLDSIAQTLIARLDANYRCLYLNSPPMVAGMRSHLAAAGVDLQRQTERGALILSSDQGHLREGKFDVDRMLQMLQAALHRALADGFAGLWASGDMTWELGSESNLAKLHEYERRLDQFIEGNPAMSGICLYHRDTLPPHAVQTALQTHPARHVDASLWQINPQYYRQLS